MSRDLVNGACVYMVSVVEISTTMSRRLLGFLKFP